MREELEQRWQSLGEFIREQRRVGHLSLRKLSEMAGISNPYLSQIERGLRKPSAEILRQIANALEISSETLYVRAGILDERQDTTDVRAEIRRDPSLTEDQKRTLVQIYESFRRESVARMGSGVGTRRRERADRPLDRSVPEKVAGLAQQGDDAPAEPVASGAGPGDDLDTDVGHSSNAPGSDLHGASGDELEDAASG